MSHGVEQMAYVGKAPWHALGNKVPDGCSIEVMVAAAGIGWKTLSKQLFYHPGADMFERVNAPAFALVREDTGMLLDVTGPDYIPTQNTDLMEFFREYLATSAMVLETAGSLWDGRIIWGLARLNVEITLAGGDVVRGYLLLANQHRYGKGLMIKFVVERVVCFNTLTMALAETGKQISIPHIKEFDDDARDAAKMKIGLAVETFKRFTSWATVMSTREITPPQVEQVLAGAFNMDIYDGEIVKPTKAIKRVKELFEGAGIGASLPSAEGTAWGLLNAVTQYVDHEYGKEPDGRMRHAWFGGGQTIKNRTMTALDAVVG